MPDWGNVESIRAWMRARDEEEEREWEAARPAYGPKTREEYEQEMAALRAQAEQTNAGAWRAPVRAYDAPQVQAALNQDGGRSAELLRLLAMTGEDGSGAEPQRATPDVLRGGYEAPQRAVSSSPYAFQMQEAGLRTGDPIPAYRQWEMERAQGAQQEPGQNGWRAPVQPYAQMDAERQADTATMQRQAAMLPADRRTAGYDVGNRLEEWAGPAWAYYESRRDQRAAENQQRIDRGTQSWYDPILAVGGNAVDLGFLVPQKALTSADSNPIMDAMVAGTALATGQAIPESDPERARGLTFAQTYAPIGGALNRLFNPFTPTHFQNGLIAPDATIDERLAALPQMFSQAGDYIWSEWQKHNAMNQALATLPEGERREAELALLNATSGAERAWTTLTMIQQKQNVRTLKETAAQVAASGDTNTASLMHQSARELEAKSYADLVDENMNVWSELVEGIFADPASLILDPIMDAGMSAWRYSRASQKIAQAAQASTKGLDAAVADGIKLAGQLEDGVTVPSASNWITQLFGRTAETKAHMEADALWKSATQLFRGVDNAEDARILLQTWIEDPAQLIRGVQGLTSKGLRDVAGVSDNRVRYGYLTVAGDEQLQALPVLQTIKEQLLNVPALSAQGGFNGLEFLTQLDDVIYKGVRQKYGLAALEELGDGVTKWTIRRLDAPGANGEKWVIDYLNGQGGIVRTSEAMSYDGAKKTTGDLQKALDAGKKTPTVQGALKMIGTVQRGFLSDMWLNLRPSHWIRNAAAATAATMADDLYSLRSVSVILDEMGAKFVGSAATSRIQETLSGANKMAGGQAGQVAKDGQHWSRAIWSKNNPYAALNEAASQVWSGMTHLFGTDIPFGEQAFYLRAFDKGFNRTFAKVWGDVVHGALDGQISQLGIDPALGRSIVDSIISTGINGGKADVARAARKAVYGAFQSFDPRTLGIADEVFSAQGWKALHNGIEEWLQNSPTPKNQINEVTAFVLRTIDEEKLRYGRILQEAAPQPGVYEWSKLDAVDDAAEMMDDLIGSARRAGVDEQQAQAQAQQLATALTDGQQQKLDEFLQEVAAVENPAAMNVAFDLLTTLHALKTGARRQVDELSRLARDAGTPEMWRRKFDETGKIYTALSEELGTAISSAADDLRTVVAGGEIPRKYDWWTALRRYFDYDQAKITELRMTPLGGSRDDAQLWEAAIDANRQYLDASMVQLYDAFRRFPSTDALDVLRSTQKSIDVEGARVAAWLAGLRDEALQGNLKWDEYFGARNSAWYRAFDNMVLYNEAAKRAIVAQGLADSVPTQLKWVDEFAGGEFFLLGPSDKQGYWWARRLDDGTIHQFDTPGRDPKQASPLVPEAVLDDWGTVTQTSSQMRPILEEIAQANPLPVRRATGDLTLETVAEGAGETEPDAIVRRLDALEAEQREIEAAIAAQESGAAVRGAAVQGPAVRGLLPGPVQGAGPKLLPGPVEGGGGAPALGAVQGTAADSSLIVRWQQRLREIEQEKAKYRDMLYGLPGPVGEIPYQPVGRIPTKEEIGRIGRDVRGTVEVYAPRVDAVDAVDEATPALDPNARLTKPATWTPTQRAQALVEGMQVKHKKTGEVYTVVKRSESGGWYFVTDAAGKEKRFKSNSIELVGGRKTGGEVEAAAASVDEVAAAVKPRPGYDEAVAQARQRLTDVVANKKPGDRVYVPPQSTVEINGKQYLINASERVKGLNLERIPGDVNYYRVTEAAGGGAATPAEAGAFTVSPYDVDVQRIERGYTGTSYTPDVRARQIQQDYVNHLENVYRQFSRYATTPEDQAKLAVEMEHYRQGYLERMYAWLDAKGRVVSSTIAGPANFPSARMEKRAATEGKRLSEFVEWQEKAQRAIHNKLTNAVIRSDSPTAIVDLQKKLQAAEQLQERMKAANKLIKKGSDEEKVAKLIELGFTEKQAQDAVTPDFMGRIGFPDYATRNNNAEIQRLKKRIAELETLGATRTETTEWAFEGGRVVDNVEEERVQIFFNERLSKEDYEKMRRAGFVYSRTNEAFQRQRLNARSAVLEQTGIDISAPTTTAVGTADEFTPITSDNMRTYESTIPGMPGMPGIGGPRFLTDDPAETLENVYELIRSMWGRRKQPEVGDVALHMINTLDDAADRIIGALPQIAQRTPNTLDAGQKRFLLQTIDGLMPAFDNAVSESRRVGEALANGAMLNYQDRRGFDTLLSLTFPYHYFWTRGGATWARRLMTQPKTLNLVYETDRAIHNANARQDVPQRLEGAIPMVQAPGGTVYMGNFLNWLLPQPISDFVDPEAANNDLERMIMRFQQITPGWMPMTQFAMDSYFDAVSPLPNGQKRVETQLRRFVPIWGLASDVTQAVTGQPLPFGEGGWDPYLARRALRNMTQEGTVDAATAQYAQQISVNLENGRERFEGIPEAQQSRAAAAYQMAMQRFGAERALSSGTGLVAGAPMYYYPKAEQEIRAAQDAYGTAGYDPVQNPYGSAAQRREVLEENPGLPVAWSASISDGELEPAQAAQRNEMWAQLDGQVYGPMATAVTRAILGNPEITSKELNAIKGPYYDLAEEIKGRFPQIPERDPRAPSGANPQERAVYELERLLAVEGKPAYPGDGATDAEKKAYYAALTAWDEKRLDTVDRRLNQLTQQAEMDPANAWQRELSRLVGGRYSSDLIRQYKELKYATDVERNWAEREALRQETTTANWNAKQGAVEERVGADGVAAWSAYHDAAKGDEREAVKQSNPLVREALMAGYNPAQYDQALTLFGPQAWDSYYSSERPAYPEGGDQAALEQYYDALQAWNTANPQDAEMRMWVNGRPVSGEFAYDFGDDWAEAKRIFGEDIFDIERAANSAQNWAAWRNANPDAYMRLTGYREWKKVPVEAREAEPETAQVFDPTGPRPLGSERRPVGAADWDTGIGGQPAVASVPTVGSLPGGVPTVGSGQGGQSGQGGPPAMGEMPGTAEGWAMRNASYAKGAEWGARKAQVYQVFGQETGSLYDQYLSLPSGGEERKAFKAEHPELRAVQLYTFQPEAFGQVVELFGQDGLMAWARTPAYLDTAEAKAARAEYLDQNPKAFSVGAWLYGRPGSDNEDTADDEQFRYNLGGDYATAKEMFGADIWLVVEGYKRGWPKEIKSQYYKEHANLSPFFDWWYGNLPKSTNLAALQSRAAYGGGGGWSAGWGGGGWSQRPQMPRIDARWMDRELEVGEQMIRRWRAPQTDLSWLRAGDRIGPEAIRKWRA